MHFKNFETPKEMKPCMKKPIVVHAMKVDEEFTCDSLEGILYGKPGDYLMRGVDGEIYICDGDIFERTYDWTEEE